MFSDHRATVDIDVEEEGNCASMFEAKAAARKDSPHEPVCSDETRNAAVAGPQQQQQRSTATVPRSRPPHEFVEHLFPHIAETHRQIRAAISGISKGTLQQNIIKTINHYIRGCRDEYEDAIASTLKCRKLARSISRTLDLLHSVCSTFADSHEYLHRIGELVAIYISCELSYANEFKEHKPLIANRISNVIYKHLTVANEEATKCNILKMFVFMPKMYKEREVMTNIFQKFITKPKNSVQLELPDKMYIQYLIVFYQWKHLEIGVEEQMRVVEFANGLMRPARTLCSNPTYAYHLPKYKSHHTATKFILENLSFFADLRNASIYDNRINSAGGMVDLCDDDESIQTLGSGEHVDFVEIMTGTKIDPVHKPVKLESNIILATVDLTLDDDGDDGDSEWLEAFKHTAMRVAPSNLRPISTAAPVVEQVIDLDSSDSENEADTANEPELFSLDFEEPERIGGAPTAYDEDIFNSSLDGDRDDEPSIGRFENNLRTYAVHREKPTSESIVTSDTAAVSVFSMPRIVDTFSCCTDPILQDNDPADETDELQCCSKSHVAELSSQKVVFSQKAPARRLTTCTDFRRSETLMRPSPELKPVPNGEGKRKKQVTFNEVPIGPTRWSYPDNVKLPIKPAISSQSKFNNYPPNSFGRYSPYVNCASPASSTSSTSESIKQQARKEHLDAIASVFSGYNLATKFTNRANTGGLSRPQMPAQNRSSLKRSEAYTSERHHMPNLVESVSPTVDSEYIAEHDQKLKQNCVVVLETDDRVKRALVVYYNSLLEEQRRKQLERRRSQSGVENVKQHHPMAVPTQRADTENTSPPKQVSRLGSDVMDNVDTSAKQTEQSVEAAAANGIHETEIMLNNCNHPETYQNVRVTPVHVFSHVVPRSRRAGSVEELIGARALSQRQTSPIKPVKIRLKRAKSMGSPVKSSMKPAEEHVEPCRMDETEITSRSIVESTPDAMKSVQQEANHLASEVLHSFATTPLAIPLIPEPPPLPTGSHKKNSNHRPKKQKASKKRTKKLDHAQLPDLAKESVPLSIPGLADGIKMKNIKKKHLKKAKQEQPKYITAGELLYGPAKLKHLGGKKKRKKVSFDDLAKKPKTPKLHSNGSLLAKIPIPAQLAPPEQLFAKSMITQDDMRAVTDSATATPVHASELITTATPIDAVYDIATLTDLHSGAAVNDNDKPFVEEPKNLDISTEVAAAASSLTLLANTAATTAPIVPLGDGFVTRLRSTPEGSLHTPTMVLTPQQLLAPEVESGEKIDGDGIGDMPIALTTENCTFGDHSQHAEPVNQAPLMDWSEIVSVTAVKDSSMPFLNLDATPTVPAYLFNGESRDVPTPTLVAIGCDQAVDAVVGLSSRTTLSNLIDLPQSLSTSDHEVSSTQETVCESPKRNLPPAGKQSFVPHLMNSGQCQDNQVDTTIYLPETYHVARRIRKLSTHDESVSQVEPTRHIKNRRKTICGEPTFGVATPPDLTLSHPSSGSSPSISTTNTTTTVISPQRKRGRPAKSATATVAMIGLPPNPPQLASNAVPGLGTGSGRGGDGKLDATKIKHTYTKNNVAQKVFVPADVEVCLGLEPPRTKERPKHGTTRKLHKNKKPKTTSRISDNLGSITVRSDLAAPQIAPKTAPKSQSASLSKFEAKKAKLHTAGDTKTPLMDFALKRTVDTDPLSALKRK